MINSKMVFRATRMSEFTPGVSGGSKEASFLPWRGWVEETDRAALQKLPGEGSQKG